MKAYFLIENKTYEIDDFFGYEKLSECFCFKINFFLPKEVNETSWVDQKAMVVFEGSNRHVVGQVFEACRVETSSTEKVTLKIKPKLFQAHQLKKPKTWINKSWQEVTSSILSSYQHHEAIFHDDHTPNQYPFLVQLPDESDWAFMKNIWQKEKVFSWFSSENDQEILHLGNHPIKIFSEKDCGIDKLVLKWSSSMSSCFRTSFIKLSPGQGFFLKGECWIVFSVFHQYHKLKGYRNKVILKRLNEIFSIKNLIKNPMPFISGIVVQRDNEKVLDDQGFYQVLLDEYQPKSFLPNVPRISPYLVPHEPKKGWHFPLPDSSRVLIGFLNGSTQNPVIMAAFPNEDLPSPVVASNNEQFSWRTRRGLEIIFDDAFQYQRCLFSSGASKTELFSEKNQAGLSWMAGESGLIFKTRGEGVWSCSGDWHQKSQSFSIRAKKTISVLVQGTIDIVAEGRYGLFSQETLRIQSKRDQRWEAADEINSKSQQSMKLISASGTVFLFSSKNNVVVRSKNRLSIHAQDHITLLSKGGSLHLKSSGEVVFNGISSISAPGGPQFLGKVYSVG